MTETAKLIASDGAAGDWLGVSVAISGDTVVVGTWGANIGATRDQGSAYVFVKPATGWVTTSAFTAKLTAADGATADLFGTSVAISGDTVVVGTWGANIGATRDQGSAYVFVKPATGWVTTSAFTAKLTAADGATADLFGDTVAISGDTVVVGASSDDIGANTSQGSAYVFGSSAAWSGWSAVPGGGQSSSAPAVVLDGSAMRLVVRGLDDGIWTALADNPQWTALGGRTNDSPAAVVEGSTLHLFVRGTDGALYLNSRSGGSFSGWSAVPGGGQSSSQPAAVFDSTGTLHLYIQGMENGFWVNSRSGSTWSGWSAVAGGGKSGSAPAVVLDGSAVRLVVRGLDDGIWTALADNPQWTALGGRTNDSPAAVVEGSTLHLVVRGTDGALYLNSRTGGSGASERTPSLEQ